MHKKSKKISIIMGVYNPKSKKQITDAVMSIVNQSYDNWELILCDDGSDEKYKETIEEVSKLDNRIRLIKNSINRGLGYSLNKCLEVAEGDYIARMDADDISEEKRLEIEHVFLENHPEYDWVGTNSKLFDEDCIWGDDKVPEKPESNDFLKYSPYIHPTIMFRKKELSEAGGYSTSDLTRRCEDYELFMRLHENGKKGYNIQEPLLLYREDQNTYSKRNMSNRMKEMIVRYQGFRKLGILHPGTFVFVIRPVIGGILPTSFLKYIRGDRRKYHVEFIERQDRTI